MTRNRNRGGDFIEEIKGIKKVGLMWIFILSWTLRGLAEKKGKLVREISMRSWADTVMLQEKNWEMVNRGKIKDLCS